MAVSLERSCVEAVFFLALAAATAILHYARGFAPAFAGLSSQPAAAAAASAAAANSPLYNYAYLLAAAATAYAAARVVSLAAAAVLPPTIKSSRAARRAALALVPPAAALVCYAGAGYPPLGGSVVARWVAGNWERNGERDLRWCGRLFVLLLFWQAVLAGAAAAGRLLLGVIWPWGAATSAGGRGKKLEEEVLSKGKAPIGDEMLAAAGGRLSGRSSPAGENGGAPGWGGGEE